MISKIGRVVSPIARISLWAALTYSLIVPSYKLASSLDSLTQYANSTREYIEAQSDEYGPERFEGLFKGFKEQAGRGEQETIRRFRRNVEKALGVDCHTIDDAIYDLPKVELGEKGWYELRMPCGVRELVVSFPSTSVEVRISNY
ncbi:MAG TPA: hypothetical protein VJI32_06985 [Candidatus Nanoarchaeia archaeon]|nr:hypothetical protein [Candidatus Nanoarchaeia archaeon]